MRHDIAPIQMLRGIAAAMVVCVHIQLQLSRLELADVSLNWLLSGVDIFFVISGFIMWVSMANRPERTAAEFMRHRIARIVPLYWLLTTLMVVTMLVRPDILQSARFDLGHIIKSYLFIAAPHPTSGKYWPVVVPGWTLNYEMFFYAVFAAAIALSHGSPIRRFVFAASFLLLAVVIAQIAPRLPGAVRYYGDPILLEFLLGIGIGCLYVRRVALPSRLWWVLVAAGFALLYVMSLTSYPRLVAAGLPAALILMGAAFAPNVGIAPLTILGDSSYSLYLSHVISLSALTQLWAALQFQFLGPVVFAVMALASSVAVGILVYRYIERPVTRLASGALRPRTENPVSKPILGS
jgi:exopolysaccharide production protein ExoZ